MKKKILNITILFIVIMVVSVVGVYAAKTIQSSAVTYNNGTSKLKSTNVQGAIDELYAKCVIGNATFNFVKYLQALEPSNTVITDDETAGHNMRYIGANPNNWVSFNGELWRIIGIFGEDSHGQSDKLIKIQYSGSIGKLKWDDSNVNDWSNASLKTYLNEGDYYTQTLNVNAKQMIQTVKWKLGGAPLEDATYYADVFYTYERGNIGAKSNPTLLEWQGDVALAYPSDYLFSTNGGLTYNRNVCLSSIARSTANVFWRTNSPVGDCAAGSWLIQQATALNLTTVMLTPLSTSTNQVYHIPCSWANGSISYDYTTNGTNSLIGPVPTVYLKSSVLCTNCSSGSVGTESNPFKIKIG